MYACWRPKNEACRGWGSSEDGRGAYTRTQCGVARERMRCVHLYITIAAVHRHRDDIRVAYGGPRCRSQAGGRYCTHRPCVR